MIRVGHTVEVFYEDEWIGGFEVRRVYDGFASVFDKAEGFHSHRFDVPLHHMRLPHNADPVWRDDQGNFHREGPTMKPPHPITETTTYEGVKGYWTGWRFTLTPASDGYIREQLTPPPARIAEIKRNSFNRTPEQCEEAMKHTLNREPDWVEEQWLVNWLRDGTIRRVKDQ